MIVEPSSFVVAIIIVVIIVFICGYFYFLSTNQGTNFLDSATGRVSANSHHSIESIAQDRDEPISFCGLSSCDNDGGCTGGDGGGGGWWVFWR